MHKLQICNLAERAEIRIYGPVGDGFLGDDSIGPEIFRDQLDAIPAGKPIDLRINSAGGAVFDGFAIYGALLPLRDRVTAYVDGQASSIASVIAMAAKRVVVSANSWIMIHEPSMLAGGDTEDFARYAELLNGIGNQIADVYASKTGKTSEEMRRLMRAETWFSGPGAVEFGLADEVSDALEVAAMANLEWFGKVPDQLKNKNGKLPNDMPNETNQAGGTPGNAVDLTAINATIAALNGRLNAERDARIQSRLKAITDGNPSIVYDDWKDKVLADESLLTTLENFPKPVDNAGAPVRTRVEVIGKPIIENYRKLKAGVEREKFRIENWDQIDRNRVDLMRAGGDVIPLNANTIAAALTPDIVADRVITASPNRLAPWGRMLSMFTMDRFTPRATVQVPFVSVGPTVLTNPASFEAGDVTVLAKPVTVNHLSAPVHITSDQLNKGQLVGNFVEAATNSLQHAISDVATALLIAGNYSGSNVIGAGTAMTVAKLSALYALAGDFDQKLLMLAPSHTAYLIQTNREAFKTYETGAYQFDGIVEQNRYTGATANSCGFLFQPKAMGLISGFPKVANQVSQLLARSVTQIGIGISVEVNAWASTASRTDWVSLDVMFGAGVIDGASGVRIITA